MPETRAPEIETALETLPLPTQAATELQTAVVDVTDENGELVTDENGIGVTEIVTVVTETTTGEAVSGEGVTQEGVTEETTTEEE